MAHVRAMLFLLGNAGAHDDHAEAPGAWIYRDPFTEQGLRFRLFKGLVHRGWTKLWSVFSRPAYYWPYYNSNPKSDHNFDNLQNRVYLYCGKMNSIGLGSSLSKFADDSLY